MNAQSQKRTAVIAAILIFVLTLGAIGAALTSVIHVRIDQITMTESYLVGSFTSAFKDEQTDADIGVLNFLPLLTELEATGTILRMQYLEAQLESLRTSDKSYAEDLMQRLEKRLDDLHRNLSRVESETLLQLQTDESYTAAITSFYTLITLLTDTTNVSSDGFGMVMSITGTLFLVASLVSSVIIVIVAFIIAIVRLVKSCTHHDLDAIAKQHPGTVKSLVCMGILAVLFNGIRYGAVVSIGGGLLVLCILFMALCFINGFVHILLADSGRAKRIAVFAVGTVSSLFLMAILLNMSNLAVHSGLHAAYPLEGSGSYFELYGLSDVAVKLAFMVSCLVEFVLVLVAATGFLRMTDKCRLTRVKNKNGELRDYKSMPMVGLFLALLMVFTMLAFRVDSLYAYVAAVRSDRATLIFQAQEDHALFMTLVFGVLMFGGAIAEIVLKKKFKEPALSAVSADTMPAMPDGSPDMSPISAYDPAADLGAPFESSAFSNSLVNTDSDSFAGHSALVNTDAAGDAPAPSSGFQFAFDGTSDPGAAYDHTPVQTPEAPSEGNDAFHESHETAASSSGFQFAFDGTSDPASAFNLTPNDTPAPIADDGDRWDGGEADTPAPIWEAPSGSDDTTSSAPASVDFIEEKP